MQNTNGCNVSSKAIKDYLGDKVWELLQSETRIGIQTSDKCYEAFKNTEETFDFSASIMPIMKCLELELRLKFYEPYLQYLKKHYNPQQYAHLVVPQYPGDQKVAGWRRLILLFVNQLVFQPQPCEFTIGDFRYSIGAHNLNKIQIDKPFIDYCETELFQGKSVNRIDIINWLKQLVLDIESLRALRNDSAHGGVIQNSTDAETALNDLVKVKKVFSNIVDPF